MHVMRTKFAPKDLPALLDFTAKTAKRDAKTVRHLLLSRRTTKARHLHVIRDFIAQKSTNWQLAGGEKARPEKRGFAPPVVSAPETT